MKRKLTAMLLTAAMITSMIPVAGAASGTPNEFYKQVGLELLPARSEGVYDEPAHPLPDVDGSGFIREIEGWTPAPVESGLPVSVTEAETGAVEISTAEEFQAITAGGSYVLTKDLDLTGVAWTPQKISGSLTLDGQGHTIKGLTLNPTQPVNCGLFASVNGAFTVKNLRLDGVEMDMAITTNSYNSYYVAVLAGYAQATTLQNVVVDVNITRTGNATPYIGGVLGQVNGKLTVSDCAFTVTIQDAEGFEASGGGVMAGLAGNARSTTVVERIYAKVDIDVTKATGSAAGGLFPYAGNSIRDSQIEVVLKGDDHNLGGVIARRGGTFELDNCVVDTSLTGRGNLGGVVGSVSQGAQMKLTDCRVTTDITMTGKAHAGGIAGYVDQSAAQLTGCAVDAVVRTQGQDRQTTAIEANGGGMFGKAYRGSMGVASCDVRANFDDFVAGNGTVGGISGDMSGFDFRDSFVDFSANGTTLRTAMYIGGMAGHADQGTVQNCGASVLLRPEFTQGCYTYAAGMIGMAGSVSMGRSYASGIIDMDTTGLETYSGSMCVGGLLGSASASMTQCYGGVDVNVNWDGGYLADVGGLAASAGTIISCWSDATVNNRCAQDVWRGSVGGLLAVGGNTVLDCCFAGEIPNTNVSLAGGLVACSSGGTVRNSYASGNVMGAAHSGGLVGGASATTTTVMFYDCWFEGNVSGTTNAGGMIGTAAGGVYRSSASGSISAPGGRAGGIAGGTTVVDDCSFDGTVSGATVGGVVGSCQEIYDSTFRGSLELELGDAVYSNVGGIAAGSGRMENCHVLNPLSVVIRKKEIGTTYQHIGGIGGEYTGIVMNCTSRGIAVHSARGVESYLLYLGGVAPGYSSMVTAENCKINGSVSYTGDSASVCMGGILGFGKNEGYGKPKASVKNCMVNGAVSVYTDPSDPGAYDILTIGGLVGDARETTLDGSHHNGAVSADSSNPSTPIIRKDPLVGTGDFALANVPGAAETTRDDENYVIRTYWHDQSGLSMFPLAGAEVSIDGAVVGTTGEDGSLTLSGSAVNNRSMVIVSAVAEGYFECSTVDFLCHGGSVDLILKKKEEGKIYLTSALIETGEGEMQEMLYSKNSVGILQDTQSPQHYFFGVDWNDTQAAGRRLELVDQNGNPRITLTSGMDMYFQLPEVFEPDEEIYLRATALQQDGTETSMQAKLPLKVKAMNLHSTVKTDEAPIGKTDKYDGLDFLNGVSMGADFGDIFKWALDVKLKNNVLTIDFGGQEPLSEKDKAKRNSGKLLNGRCKVSVGGKLQLDMNSDEKDLYKWAGEVYAKAAMSPLFEHTVPLGAFFKATSTINFGGSFGGGFEGNHDSATFYGRIGIDGDVDIMIKTGPSASEEWEIVLGPDVRAEGGFDFYAEPMLEQRGRFAANLSGALSFKVEINAGEWFEFEPGFQLGSFTWDNEKGAKFYALGAEIAPAAALNSGYWIPSTQSYLTSGGGFQGGLSDVAALNAWNGTPVVDGEQANVAQLYENIVQGSTAALTVENGQLVLYFTADDGNRELEGNVADHTGVWRTVCTDGAWSEPVMVSGSGNGYPDNLCADGAAAIWVESTKTGSLEELLTSTRIKVAVNGEVFHTIETGGHAYNAKVSAADDGSNILVSWFSAPEVNSLETMLTAEPTLCYARYADGAWSQGTVPTGEKVPVDATPVYTEPFIAWTDTNGQQYRNARTDFTYNAVWIADLERADHNGNFTAEMESDGTLVIWEGTAQRAKLQTGSAGNEAPMLLDDGNGTYYAIWTERDGIYYADSASGWAYAKPICALEQQIMRLSGAIMDGLPVVTWYQSDYNKDKTDFIYHLYTAQAPDLSKADLAVSEVTLDEEGVGETGLMTVSAEVVNHGEEIITQYAYAVTDETGKEYFAGTVSDVSLGYQDSDLCHALIAVDVSEKHTYTVTVTAEGDVNGGNNAGSAAAQSEAELSAAAFQLMPDGAIGLKAVATNAGSAPLADMMVEIYRCSSDGTPMGSVLAAESFENVLSGSYRQLILNEAVMDTLYKVVLTSGGEEVDSEMLMWSDPEASGAWITGVDISEDGQAKVKLSAQHWAEDLMLHLAVYDENGRMAAVAMENLEAWTGNKELKFDFADELKEGAYTYSAFLLKQNGLIPVAKKISGEVTLIP